MHGHMNVKYVVQVYKVVFSLTLSTFCHIYSSFSDIATSLVSLSWVWHLWPYSVADVCFWCSKGVLLSKRDTVY